MAIGSVCTELTGYLTTPGTESAGNTQNARSFASQASIVLSAQTVAAGDILLFIADEGSKVRDFNVITDTSLSTTTFSIVGLDSGTTYVAGGTTLTATNTLTVLCTAAMKLLAALTRPDRIVFRPAIATLPGSGNLIFGLNYTRP
jgi:hypothetical protein